MAKTRIIRDIAHIFVMCGFAVAQPIYDLLGNNGEFFVAHRAGPLGIVAFVLALSLGLPAVLGLIEIVAAKIGTRLQTGIHLLFMALLATALAAPIINRSVSLPPAAAGALAVMIGLTFAWAYARFAALGSFVSILALGAVAFPVLFLFFSSISNLVFSAPVAQQSAGAIKSNVPIVFLILDEFEAGSLLDENKEIDPIRFPHFAALAKESLWFPNATSSWFETKYAVPAILTGRMPRSASALPTLQSHPDNLFTWLDGRYRFTVKETLTALCPERACPPEQVPNGVVRGAREIAADLGVLYLHILLPPSVARLWLPPMDTGWNGFGAGAKGDDHEAGAKNRRDPVSAYRERDEQFLEFIQGIKGGDRNVLHFLHVLLPHVRYTYLPSGKDYAGGATEGLVDKGLADTVWVDDGVLPAVAYQRFLLQVGYVDRLVGKLVERLKAEGMYDEALVIITSDHGKSFWPGEPKRLLSDGNAPDVLQVPLFVKLPGQGQGLRVDKYVSNIDVVPTIAQVLGTTLPWPVDGRSLLDPTYQGRDVIELASISGGRSGKRYNAKELASYPRLPWKLATFGSRTPFDLLAVRTHHPELIGTRPENQRVREGAGTYAFAVEQERLISNISLASSFLPAHLTGEIQGSGLPSTPLTLAVALNGTIRAVTRTSQWANKRHYLSLMLPEAAFREGANSLELFAVEDKAGGLSLVRILSAIGGVMTLARDAAGNEQLLSEAGQPVPVKRGAMKGYLDRAQAERGSYTFSGWAIDAEQMRPADRILLLVDGKQAYLGPLGRTRSDVAKVFGQETFRDSGFQFMLPRPVVQGGKLRVFAVSAEGVAGEIEIGKAALNSLKGTN